MIAEQQIVFRVVTTNPLKKKLHDDNNINLNLLLIVTGKFNMKDL